MAPDLERGIHGIKIKASPSFTRGNAKKYLETPFGPTGGDL